MKVTNKVMEVGDHMVNYMINYQRDDFEVNKVEVRGLSPPHNKRGLIMNVHGI